MLKLAFIGEQCSGKSSAAEWFREFWKPVSSRIVKFADPIYGALAALHQQKHRAFMQGFGDLAKEHFGEMVFTDAFSSTVRRMEKDRLMPANGLILCDDVRYGYELDRVHELGFLTVFIDAHEEIRRSRAEALGLGFITGHNSEQEIQGLREHCHHVLDSNGTADDLAEECARLCDELLEGE